MKKKLIKTVAIVFCMLIAGIVFSCGKKTDLTELAEETEAPLVQEDTRAEAQMQESAESQTKAQEADTNSENEADEGSVCVVYVCGAVNCPNVYVLNTNNRIADAVKAAGGFTEEANRDYLNLAEHITDGEKIYIPTVEDTSEPPAFGVSYESNSPEQAADSLPRSGKININSAGIDELKKLNGIGDARAKAIVDYRNEHGNFESIESIMNVPGIKEGAFEKIKNEITV